MRHIMALAGLLVALFLIAGFRIYVVNGNSMLPALEDGDCIVVLPVNPLKKGDIIVYEREGELIVHRIVEKCRNYVITKGDNLKAPKALEKVSYEKIRGTVIVSLPGGRATAALIQALCVCVMVAGVYASVEVVKRRL